MAEKTVMTLHLNYVRDLDTKQGKEIYCRRKHKLCVPTIQECTSCHMFHGIGGGDMLECEWEDVPTSFGGDLRRVYWQDRRQELMRVSKLIDDKTLTR